MKKHPFLKDFNRILYALRLEFPALSLRSIYVFSLIAEKGRINMAELGEISGENRVTLMRITRQLATQCYLITIDDDSIPYIYQLSREGKQALKRAATFLESVKA